MSTEITIISMNTIMMMVVIIIITNNIKIIQLALFHLVLVAYLIQLMTVLPWIVEAIIYKLLFPFQSMTAMLVVVLTLMRRAHIMHCSILRQNFHHKIIEVSHIIILVLCTLRMKFTFNQPHIISMTIQSIPKLTMTIYTHHV